MKNSSILAVLASVLTMTACSRDSELEQTSNSSAVVNKPGACAGDAGISSFQTLFLACRNTTMTPNLMTYCMTNYKTKFDVLTTDCKSDFEGLANVRKGTTTFMTNAARTQLGLGDAAKKDVFDQAGLDQTMSYLHAWTSAFSAAYYTKAENGDYVPSIEGALSQYNALIDQKHQSIALKDKTKFQKETALKYELLALESALKSYVPGQGSDLLIASRLNSALAAAAPRIDTLARIHDMACSVESCQGGTSKSNLVPLVRLLGSIGQTTLAANASAIKSTFTAGSDYQKLAQIFETYGPALSSVVSKAFAQRSGSINFEELGRFGEKYKAMSDRYTREGFFRDTESNLLVFGFSEEARDNVKSLLATLRLSLTTDKAEFNAAAERLFQDLQNLNSSDSELQKTAISIEGIARDIASINFDILGLEEANRNDEGSLARYAEQMSRVLDGNKDLKGGLTGDPAFPNPQTIKGSDAKFSLKDSALKREISKLAVTKVQLKKGQTLNLAVSGEWSPVCALRESYGSQAKFRYDAIRTGPEGYSSIQGLNSSTTNSRESFNSYVKSDTNGNQTQSCISASATQALGSSGLSGSISSSECRSSGSSIEFSHGYRNARTAADSITDSASFQGGLMLSTAPFAQYPAGSLLAFVSPVGSEDFISARLDVKVMGRQTTVYAPEDVTVSVVVNDCLEGNSSLADGLSLQGEILTPKTAAAKSVMESVLARMPEFRKTANLLLKQGIVIDEQLAIKKAELIASISEADASFLKVPEIQSIVNFWIDNEILKVKRMAQINAKSREMARLFDESRRLGLQQEFLRTNTAAFRIRLNESISRLGLAPLEASVNTVADIVVKRMLPVLRFYALAGLPNTAGVLKKSIIVDADPFDLTMAVDTFLKELSNNISSKESDLSNTRQTGRLVIRLPRPGAPISTKPVASLPTLDAARSLAMWRALLGEDSQGIFNAEPAISLNPSDLYSKTNLFGLNCRTSNVVIDDMALIFLVNANVNVSDIEELNQIPGISMQAGPGFEFTSPLKAETFMLRDPNEGNYNVKIGFLAEDKALSFGEILNRGPFDQNSGKGLSPFASFKFAAGPLRTFLGNFYAETLGFPIKSDSEPVDDGSDIFGNQDAGTGFDSASLPANITDVLVAFKIRGLNKNNELSWLDSCK